MRAGCALAVAAVGLGAAGFVQHRIDTARPEEADELLYLPNENLLTYLTGGMHTIIADLLWLETVQYTAKQFRSQERKFTWLEHMANTTVRLDPYFTGAYVYGATFMAGIGNDEGATRLLHKGLTARPDRYEIPFEMAKIYMMNRRKWDNALAATSYYLAWAGARADDPEWAQGFMDWSRNLQRQHSLIEAGRQVWASMLENAASPMMRDLAKHNIALLDAEALRDSLRQTAARFEDEQGRRPADLTELVRQDYREGIPRDPLGGTFFLDDRGEVRSESVLKDEEERRLGTLRAGIQRFKDEHGRYPESLRELADANSIPAVPRTPLPEQQWMLSPDGRRVDAEPELAEMITGNPASAENEPSD
jgi:hypothetical protein